VTQHYLYTGRGVTAQNFLLGLGCDHFVFPSDNMGCSTQKSMLFYGEQINRCDTRYNTKSKLPFVKYLNYICKARWSIWLIRSLPVRLCWPQPRRGNCPLSAVPGLPTGAGAGLGRCTSQRGCTVPPSPLTPPRPLPTPHRPPRGSRPLLHSQHHLEPTSLPPCSPTARLLSNQM